MIWDWKHPAFFMQSMIWGIDEWLYWFFLEPMVASIEAASHVSGSAVSGIVPTLTNPTALIWELLFDVWFLSTTNVFELVFQCFSWSLELACFTAGSPAVDSYTGATIRS